MSRSVPPSGFLNLSTVFSANPLSGLFHPEPRPGFSRFRDFSPRIAPLPLREELPPCRWSSSSADVEILADFQSPRQRNPASRPYSMRGCVSSPQAVKPRRWSLPSSSFCSSRSSLVAVGPAYQGHPSVVLSLPRYLRIGSRSPSTYSQQLTWP